MDSKRTFTTPNKDLCSSDYTQYLRSKTKYSTSANLAKTMVENGGSLPMTDNNVIKTYKGPYTFSSTDLNNPNGVYCINQSKSYEDLLDITKGKYLLTPQRLNSTYITKDNLQVSQLYNSVFFDFDYEGPALQLTLPSPGVPENTIVYDNTTDNQQLINVDNTYALFYNSKDNCYSSLFNFGYITLNNRTIDAVLAMRRIQIHNLLNGFTYPRKFALETCLNPVNDVNYDTFIPIIITSATNVNTLSNITLDITWHPPVLNGEVLIDGAYRVLYSGPTSGEIITNNTYCSLPIPFAQGVQYNIYVQKQYPTVTAGGIQYFTSLELIAPLVISTVVGGSGAGPTTDVTFDWLPPTLGGQLLTPGGYKIYYGSTFVTVPSTVTSHTILGVDKITQSSIYVVGLDIGGNEIFESQTLLAPLIITSAVGGSIGNTEVTIYWLPPTLNVVPVTTGGYKIYKDTFVIATVPSSATSYPITGLDQNTQSNIYVVGLDSGGNEIFTSQTLLAPLVITSAVGGTTGNTEVTITWSPPILNNVIITTGGYNIYNGITVIANVPSSSATTYSYPITGLGQNTQSNIYVKGLIPGGNVFNSQSLVAPLVITSAVGGTTGNTDVTITWSPPILGGVIITTGGYNIYNGITVIANVPSSSATTYSYPITGLGQNTQSNIYVKGLIPGGNVFNSQSLVAPLVITSAVGGTTGNTEVTIYWSPPTLGGQLLTPGGYNIYKDGLQLNPLPIPVTTPTYTIPGLGPNAQSNIYVEGLGGGTFYSQSLVAPLVITSTVINYINGINITWLPPTLGGLPLATISGYDISYNSVPGTSITSPISGEISVTASTTTHTIPLNYGLLYNIYVTGGTFVSQTIQDTIIIPEVIVYNNPQVFPKSGGTSGEVGLVIGIPSSGLNPLTGFSQYTNVTITNLYSSGSDSILLSGNLDKYLVYGEPGTASSFINTLMPSTASNIALVEQNTLAAGVSTGKVLQFDFSGGTSPDPYTCYYDPGYIDAAHGSIVSMYYTISATLPTIPSVPDAFSLKGRFDTQWMGYGGSSYTNPNNIQQAWGISANSASPSYAPLIQTGSPPNHRFYPETNIGSPYYYYNGIPKMIAPIYS